MVQTSNEEEHIDIHRESDIIGKIIILSLSESEEYIIEKIVALFFNENMDILQRTGDLKRNLRKLEIDSKKHLVFKNGIAIPLSSREFSALYCLARRPGIVFSKEQIYQIVYGEEPVETIDNIIYCLIRSVRKKLEDDPRHPEYIQTVRDVGYKFVIPEE